MFPLYGFPSEQNIAVCIKPCRILVPTIEIFFFEYISYRNIVLI